MTTTLKKIWNVLSTVLVVLVVLCAVFLMGSRILGYQVFTVLSGSMEPKYMTGDLLYVKGVDPNTIQVGDDITFVMNAQLDIATHQVVRIDAKNQRFYTKGLANDIEDAEPVHFKNVIGVPQFAIPKLGYVSNYIQNPPGTYVVIGVGVVLVLLVFLPDMLRKKSKEEQEDAPANDSATQEENERLKAELERLRAEMQEANAAQTE